MADDKSKRGSPDNDLINTAEPYEMRDWAKQMGVSEAELEKAVEAVGNSAQKVRAHLSK